MCAVRPALQDLQYPTNHPAADARLDAGDGLPFRLDAARVEPLGRLAVNVAEPQIQGGNFVAAIEQCLLETGFSADHLELAVTEGFVMRRASDSINQPELLRGMGIQIAIDDFGTGYSSLGYLKRLPIDKLKIDQSFVRDIPADRNDMAISEAVIVMALGMRTIAEGVETEEQASFLRGRGCEEAQGYLFSRPVPAEELEAFLK